MFILFVSISVCSERFGAAFILANQAAKQAPDQVAGQAVKQIPKQAAKQILKQATK
jgi:hypothetical protein